MFFRLMTAPGPNQKYMNLFEIGSTSTSTVKSQFTAFFRGGELMCDFGWNEAMRIGAMPSLGEWHMIQAVVNYGSSTYTARVSLDGAAPRTLTSAADKTRRAFVPSGCTTPTWPWTIPWTSTTSPW